MESKREDLRAKHAEERRMEQTATLKTRYSRQLMRTIRVQKLRTNVNDSSYSDLLLVPSSTDAFVTFLIRTCGKQTEYGGFH
jgi:hypothetical protein